MSSTPSIVMLSSLGGPGIDLMPGDAVTCSAATAAKLLKRPGLARAYDAKQDSARRVKDLPDAKRAPKPTEKKPTKKVVDLAAIPSRGLLYVDAGVTDEHVEAIVDAGLLTVADVAAASDSALNDLPNIGPAAVTKIRAAIELIADGKMAALDDE